MKIFSTNDLINLPELDKMAVFALQAWFFKLVHKKTNSLEENNSQSYRL